MELFVIFKLPHLWTKPWGSVQPPLAWTTIGNPEETHIQSYNPIIKVDIADGACWLFYPVINDWYQLVSGFKHCLFSLHLAWLVDSQKYLSKGWFTTNQSTITWSTTFLGPILTNYDWLLLTTTNHYHSRTPLSTIMILSNSPPAK